MGDTSARFVSADSVLFTHELQSRATRPPQLEKENRALRDLVQALADSPESILRALTDTILRVLECGSAGVSLLTQHDGGKRFYWPSISGVWQQHIGGGTPREFGPCGTVLDQNKTLLFRHIENFYTYFEPVKPRVKEALLVPFYSEGKAVGTVWAVAHEPDRPFDAEDQRLLESLAQFASGAYQAVRFLENQRRTAAIVESSDDAIVSKNLDGIISSWNQGAERLFGYKADEIVGSSILTVVPPELHQEEQRILAKLRNGERIDHFETVRLRKDGSRVEVSLTISPVRDNTGKIVGASKIARDISQRKKYEAALKETEFSARILRTQDEDRRRIARELHDGVGQTIAAIAMNNSMIEKEKDKLPENVSRSVSQNEKLIQQASSDIRTVAYLLHPPLLDEIGLRSALEWYVEGFAERSKIEARLVCPKDLPRLPELSELVIFRIAQECLTNIHRHANCTKALVELASTATELKMRIQDNGQGISEEKRKEIAAGKSTGVGLRGMRERIHNVGGTFDIDSNEKGTTVFVTLPLGVVQASTVN
jgi:PAS domain S-box-containing protein